MRDATFMGYTPHAAPDQVAFGLSAIGCLAGRFVQNDTGLARYGDALDDCHFPVVRGHRMSRDDEMRSLVIQHLLCNLEIREDLTETEFGAPVSGLLGEELDGLAPFVEEGFLSRSDHGWQVSDVGRFFVRNVAASRDPYLKKSTRLPTFSSSV